MYISRHSIVVIRIHGKDESRVQFTVSAPSDNVVLNLSQNHYLVNNYHKI